MLMKGRMKSAIARATARLCMRMGVFEVRDVLWGWWRLAPRRGIMHVRAMWKVTC